LAGAFHFSEYSLAEPKLAEAPFTHLVAVVLRLCSVAFTV